MNRIPEKKKTPFVLALLGRSQLDPSNRQRILVDVES